jgi:hypothetical protein
MPEKGFLLGQVKGRIGDTGRKAEARASKRLAGRQTRASGAMDSDKGDIELPEFLCENKATEAESFSLKHDVLAKIAREALEVKRAPALTLQFVDSIGRPKKFGSWVMIPESLFEEVQALYRERMG